MIDFKYVIWDFNGTLLDDVETGVKAVNSLLTKRGKPIIESVEDYRKVFRFPIIDYYKDVGFDFTKEPFEQVAVEWVRAYEKYEEPRICKGVKPVIEKFREYGCEQVIISASETNMLKRQLEAIGLGGTFSCICGRDDIYASDKIEIAKKWASGAGDGRRLFIGDMTHDYETAKAIDAECILLANGHQCRERLETCGCDVVDGAWDILKAAEKIGCRI